MTKLVEGTAVIIRGLREPDNTPSGAIAVSLIFDETLLPDPMDFPQQPGIVELVNATDFAAGNVGGVEGFLGNRLQNLLLELRQHSVGKAPHINAI